MRSVVYASQGVNQRHEYIVEVVTPVAGRAGVLRSAYEMARGVVKIVPAQKEYICRR